MTRIADPRAATVATFTYDAVGKRESACNGTRAYGYDGADRLTSLGIAANQPYDNAEAFAYNPASQLSSASRSNNAYVFTGFQPVGRAYTVNKLNQYTQAGSGSFSYDLNGKVHRLRRS